MSSDLARKLHPQERLVLLSLKSGEATDKSIAAATGLPVAAVNKAGLWLKLKGLIEHRDRKEFRMSLTQEGRSYAKSGLPEKILLKACEKEQGLEALRKKVPELTIALAWAKRSGWIEIDRGRIKLTSDGKSALSRKTELEKALEAGVPPRLQ